MSDLLELAKRCEAATGPDRELDAEIARALGHKIKPQTSNYTMEMFYAIEWQAPHPYAGMKEPCPAWTASLDAALTLVPKGWTRSVDATAPECGIKVELYPPTGGGVSSDHAEEPLATCAAALRARANPCAAQSS